MSGLAVGIDIGGTKMLLLARDADRGNVREVRVPTGPDTTPEQLERHIHDFTDSLPRPPRSIGIAIPGLVNTAAGQVEMSDVLPHLDGWQPTNLLGPHVRQILVGDIRAALAHTSRALPPRSTAVMLIAGTAIGMAWMADGAVVNGASGWAGEMGYLPVRTPTGLRRLDELAGGAAIVAAAALEPAEIHAAIATGDPRIQTIVDAAGEAFGLALATAINLLNPHLITVAGGTLGYPGYLTAALRTAEHAAVPPLWQACKIQRADDEARVVALGALHLATQTT